MFIAYMPIVYSASIYVILKSIFFLKLQTFTENYCSWSIIWLTLYLSYLLPFSTKTVHSFFPFMGVYHVVFD